MLAPQVGAALERAHRLNRMELLAGYEQTNYSILPTIKRSIVPYLELWKMVQGFRGKFQVRWSRLGCWVQPGHWRMQLQPDMTVAGLYPVKHAASTSSGCTCLCSPVCTRWCCPCFGYGSMSLLWL